MESALPMRGIDTPSFNDELQEETGRIVGYHEAVHRSIDGKTKIKIA